MMFDKDDPRAEDKPDEQLEDPRDWDKASRAVIAYSGKHGIVIWYVGAHVESMIEGVGGRDIEELGFEGDPPIGISVWEGRTTGGRRNWEGDYDDAYLTGTYRTPNAEEWAAIQLHKNPWNEDDWLLPKPEPYVEQCTDCGAPQPHFCEGVPGGFSDEVANRKPGA